RLRKAPLRLRAGHANPVGPDARPAARPARDTRRPVAAVRERAANRARQGGGGAPGHPPRGRPPPPRAPAATSGPSGSSPGQRVHRVLAENAFEVVFAVHLELEGRIALGVLLERRGDEDL